jgi:hypothetical protein
MDILQTIVKGLRDAGPGRWPGIARELGLKPGTLRKIAYNDIRNPGLRIAQPLLDYFEAVRRRQRRLPPPEARQPKPTIADAGSS